MITLLFFSCSDKDKELHFNMTTVSSITIAAQHPEGVELHLNNINWAIDNPKDIYLLTFKKWNLSKFSYKAKVIEVDEDPLQNHPFYQFWKYEALNLIKNLQSEIIVINQLDIFYTTKLYLYINEIKHNPDMVFNLNTPEPGRYSLFQEEKFVYPRIYEAGLIVNRELLIKAIEKGLHFGNGIDNPDIIQFMKKNKLSFLVDNQLLPHGHPYKGGYIKGDCMAEFMLFCYMNKIRALTRDYAIHLQAPETLHLNYPELYSNFEKNIQELITLDPKRTAATAISLKIAGLCSNKLIEKYKKTISKYFQKDLINLNFNAKKWMDNRQFKEFRFILETISN